MGVAWPSAQEVPWLDFQPPCCSPVPCGTLGRGPSHLSAWEVPPAISSNTAESVESSAGGLLWAACAWPLSACSSAGHTVGGPLGAQLAGLLRGFHEPWQPAGPEGKGSAWQPASLARQALPPALSRVLAASLGCCLVAHLPCSLQRPACLGWTPRPELASAPWTALCLPRSPHSWDAWSLRHCLGPQASCPPAHSCPRPTGFCPLSPGHLRGPGTISIFQHHPFHDL